MFGASPAKDDWVALTRKVPVSLADSLTGSGLPPGTRGVVLDRRGRRLEVKFNYGLGSVHATVACKDIRVVRHRGGVAHFDRRTSTRNALRFGVMLALAAPFLWFVVEYLWVNRTTHGLVPALLNGVIQGALDMLAAAFAHPLQAVIYMATLSALSRWVWHS